MSNKKCNSNNGKKIILQKAEPPCDPFENHCLMLKKCWINKEEEKCLFVYNVLYIHMTLRY